MFTFNYVFFFAIALVITFLYKHVNYVCILVHVIYFLGKVEVYIRRVLSKLSNDLIKIANIFLNI